MITKCEFFYVTNANKINICNAGLTFMLPSMDCTSPLIVAVYYLAATAAA